MTVKEYIAIAGITPAAITYRIKNNLPIPGIASYRYDENKRMYLLTKLKSFKNDNVKKAFRAKK